MDRQGLLNSVFLLVHVQGRQCVLNDDYCARLKEWLETHDNRYSGEGATGLRESSPCLRLRIYLV